MQRVICLALVDQACFLCTVNAEEALIIVSQMLRVHDYLMLLAPRAAPRQHQLRRDITYPDGLADINETVLVLDIL